MNPTIFQILKKNPFVIFFVGFLCLKILTITYPFFWDSKVIISAQAIHFFEGGSIFNIPNEINPGHAPLISYLHYLCWMLFGKSLLVSNLVSIPIVGILFYATSKLGQKIFQQWQYSFLLLALLFIDPAIICHLLIASPEVFILSGFVSVLYGVLSGSKRWLVFGSVLMCLSSIRGVMLAMSFVPLIIYLNKKNKLHQLSLLFIGVTLFLSYALMHFYEQGWAIVNPSDNWSQVKEVSDLSSILKKSFGYVFRNLEAGRWLELAAVSIMLFYQKKKRKFSIPFLVLFITGHLIYFVVVVFFDINFGTRYFIPFFYVLHIVFVFLVSRLSGLKTRLLIAAVCLSLVTGHFWLYQGRISQSWDTTILHTNFYRQWTQVYSFMKAQNIAVEETGAQYPFLRPLDFHFINGDKRSLQKMNLETNKFVLYTSCSNSYESKDIEKLMQNWQPIFEEGNGGVKTILFKRKE